MDITDKDLANAIRELRVLNHKRHYSSAVSVMLNSDKEIMTDDDTPFILRDCCLVLFTRNIREGHNPYFNNVWFCNCGNDLRWLRDCVYDLKNRDDDIMIIQRKRNKAFYEKQQAIK